MNLAVGRRLHVDTSCSPLDQRVERGLLLDEWKQVGAPSVIVVVVVGLADRQVVVGVNEVVTGKPELLEVVRTLRTTRRFSRRLNGGQKQRDQDSNDRDYYEQFY
jgi:hypothetical protein